MLTFVIILHFSCSSCESGQWYQAIMLYLNTNIWRLIICRLVKLSNFPSLYPLHVYSLYTWIKLKSCLAPCWKNGAHLSLNTQAGRQMENNNICTTGNAKDVLPSCDKSPSCCLHPPPQLTVVFLSACQTLLCCQRYLIKFIKMRGCMRWEEKPVHDRW